MTDPDMNRDVIDLVAATHDRMRCALFALPCDEELRGLPTPIALDNVDWFCTAAMRRETCEALAELPVTAFVIALSAPRPIPPEVVLRWHDSFRRAFAARDVRMLGLFTATAYPDQVTPIAHTEPGSRVVG